MVSLRSILRRTMCLSIESFNISLMYGAENDTRPDEEEHGAGHGKSSVVT